MGLTDEIQKGEEWGRVRRETNVPSLAGLHSTPYVRRV